MLDISRGGKQPELTYSSCPTIYSKCHNNPAGGLRAQLMKRPERWSSMSAAMLSTPTHISTPV
eukprot:3976601-Pyramimonas_sp.AAC.1